jgi:hypothetical protein
MHAGELPTFSEDMFAHLTARRVPRTGCRTGDLEQISFIGRGHSASSFPGRE